MKTSLPLKSLFVATVIFCSTMLSAQELVFKNASLYSGNGGTDGAVYKFPSINATHDALVKISGRSSSVVKLKNIDQSSTGFSNAFQPQIEYNNGNVNGTGSWWMEFEIKFVAKNTENLLIIPNFKTTALDMDGDNNKLREWNSFYGLSSYTVENNSLLSVSSLMENVLGILTNVGKKFDGSTTLFTLGVDTTNTQIMSTVNYINKSVIKFRAGISTTGNSNMAERMYSFWFKDFSYASPISTLPVKLTSFSAMLNNNKVDLKWSTASEVNVNYFMVEKSIDGVNFTDAGMVFAYGNETEKANYSLADNINGIQSGVIYYRLRSVDNDGKSQLSETRIIRISKTESNNITITTYPNPVTSDLRITVPANWQNKKVMYEVVNLNGQVAKKVQTANSSQTENVNVSSLSPGMYVVRVSCEGETAQQKIVKQ